MSWMNLEEWCWLQNLVLQTYTHTAFLKWYHLRIKEQPLDNAEGSLPWKYVLLQLAPDALWGRCLTEMEVRLEGRFWWILFLARRWRLPTASGTQGLERGRHSGLFSKGSHGRGSMWPHFSHPHSKMSHGLRAPRWEFWGDTNSFFNDQTNLASRYFMY